MSITVDDVEHIANLAKLALTEDEKQLYADQLGSILGYIDKLKELDTENIPPTSTILPLEGVMREDDPQAEFEREELLANASDKEDGMFRVKVVLDES